MLLDPRAIINILSSFTYSKYLKTATNAYLTANQTAGVQNERGTTQFDLIDRKLRYNCEDLSNKKESKKNSLQVDEYQCARSSSIYVICIDTHVE